MYIPSQFQGQEPEQALVFMQHYSFAPLVRAIDGKANVTQLPF